MSVSCMCENEYEWVFDMSPWTRHSSSPQRSTWITMMVRIHPLGDGLDSWSFTLPRPPGWYKEPNRMWSYFFSAWTLDGSGAPLNVTAIWGEDEESVTVYFGAPQGDGYEFAVKWFQENIPDIDLETGVLTAEWSWTDDAAHLHVVHVWFPQGYALTKVTAGNYTQEMLEGRVYVTFSGVGAPGGEFRWSVVAKKSASSATSSQNLTTSSGTEKEPMPLMLGQTAPTILTMVVTVVGSVIYLVVCRRRYTWNPDLNHHQGELEGSSSHAMRFAPRAAHTRIMTDEDEKRGKRTTFSGLSDTLTSSSTAWRNPESRP